MNRAILFGVGLGLWTLAIYWLGYLFGKMNSEIDHTIKEIDRILDRILVKKSG